LEIYQSFVRKPPRAILPRSRRDCRLLLPPRLRRQSWLESSNSYRWVTLIWSVCERTLHLRPPLNQIVSGFERFTKAPFGVLPITMSTCAALAASVRCFNWSSLLIVLLPLLTCSLIVPERFASYHGPTAKPSLQHNRPTYNRLGVESVRN
jgi:hypothetical protein